MTKTKIAPPKETKAQLMAAVIPLLEQKYRDPIAAVEYLLNFFTAYDLSLIIQELQNATSSN